MNRNIDDNSKEDFVHFIGDATRNDQNNNIYQVNEWNKREPVNTMNVAEQLEKWNKVRESLYSQNGWCSANVNQNSKWDVGDIDAAHSMRNFVHNDAGTNLWDTQSCAQQVFQSNDYVPVTHDNNCMPMPSKELQYENWQKGGAIPKGFSKTDQYNYNYDKIHKMQQQQQKFNLLTANEQFRPNNVDYRDGLPSILPKRHHSNNDDSHVPLYMRFQSMNLSPEYGAEYKDQQRGCDQNSLATPTTPSSMNNIFHYYDASVNRFPTSVDHQHHQQTTHSFNNNNNSMLPMQKSPLFPLQNQMKDYSSQYANSYFSDNNYKFPSASLPNDDLSVSFKNF